MVADIIKSDQFWPETPGTAVLTRGRLVYTRDGRHQLLMEGRQVVGRRGKTVGGAAVPPVCDGRTGLDWSDW